MSRESVTVEITLSEMEADALRALIPKPGSDTTYAPEWVRSYGRSAIEAIVTELDRGGHP